MNENNYSVPLLTERNFADISIITSQGDFYDLLNQFYDELKSFGISMSRLSRLSGLNISTISNLLKRKRKPTVYSLTVICIAMRLYYPWTKMLFQKANLSLNPGNPIDNVFLKYILGCGFSSELTVDACKKELCDKNLRDKIQLPEI